MLFSSSLMAAAFAASVNAHMILKYPVPYGKSSLNNSPLERFGSDFPCKARTGAYEVTEMNQWNAGETKEISFIGSAVHGGGSCQFSLTTDLEPTKDTQWKVIHSVIGGCPSKVKGNITPENAQGEDADKFPVTLPKDTPPGKYSFAWTWFNKVGNREMYMNCAPIEVGGSGGAGDVNSVLGKLPDMFVANLPNDTCATVAEFDYVFPEPGESVVTGALANPGTSLSGDCASMTKMGAGAGSMGSPSEATGAPVSGGVSSAIATPAPSATGGVPGEFAPGASSQASPSTLVVSQAPVSAAPTGSPTGSPVTPPSSPATGDCAHPCTNEGGVVCISETEFGLCNFGCAVSQGLAAGMSCTNGAIQKRNPIPRRARHFHRRHGSLLS